MEQLLKDYERYLLGGAWAPSSVRQYVYEAKFFLRSVGRPLSKCTREDIEGYLAKIALGSNRPYQRSTRRRKLATLRVFFDYAVSRNLLEENPCYGIRAGKVPIKDIDVLLEEEVGRVFETLSADTSHQGKMFLSAVSLQYYLGLRVSEVAGVEISHVVQRESLQLTVRAKGGKIRIFPLKHSKLQSYFLPWWNIRRTFRGPSPALFIDPNTKKPLSVRTIQRRLRVTGEAAGLPIKLHPHLLRRSFATHLYRKDVDIFTIASLLGHSRIEVTRRHYVLPYNPKQEAALLLLP